MTKPSIERVSESRCFEGRQLVYQHRVDRLCLHDALRRVFAARRGARARPRAVLALGSHLHRRELQRESRRAALRRRARLGLDHSGHEPTRRQHPRRGRADGRRHRRRLLHQRDGAALGRALPHVRLHSRRAASRRQRQLARRRRSQVDQRPFNGRPRRHHHRDRQSAELSIRIGFRADRVRQPVRLGPACADGVFGARPRALARV